MMLDFPVFKDNIGEPTNYDLFMMPNGVYRARGIKADNYLYPAYFMKEGKELICSSSVYSLIRYKKQFIRNPKFQTTYFYRPSFLTVDKEIMRARTSYRRSTLELTKKKDIIPLGAGLIQDYITDVENKYPGYTHILLMGGKDSQNIILAGRKEKWIVFSGGPDAPLNEEFISKNRINIHRFIKVPEPFDTRFLLQEIIASDCMFDVTHFRWVSRIFDLVNELGGKAVLWMGTSGDGIFKRNNNHRDRDYYAVHDLHVGMAMGVLHQMFKNLLNIPVLSPYQSPRFLDELFYKFDPYFVAKAEDMRPEVGEILFGRPVWYPNEDPKLKWKSTQRNRAFSIPRYIAQLRCEGISCSTNGLPSFIRGAFEKAGFIIDVHSAKRRTAFSKVLFPLRRGLANLLPFFRIKRHDITSNEIK